MLVLGLTGSIAMGKSHAAAVFRRLHIPVFDADAAVHALPRRGGLAVEAIGKAFAGTVQMGAVDRALLGAQVLASPERLKALEAILHPMVNLAMRRFLQRQRRAGTSVAVLDVPLLLESSSHKHVDVIVVVSAPASVQALRLRRRSNFTAAQTVAVLDRQMPDAQKRSLADVLIRTGLSRYHSQKQIRRLLGCIR